jgi:hypothetical protein
MQMKKLIALTGAGISAESGIATFRDSLSRIVSASGTMPCKAQLRATHAYRPLGGRRYLTTFESSITSIFAK